MMSIKTAILTIDDAPSVDMRGKLDFLSTLSIPAIWFCQGNYLEQRPDLVLNAIGKGYFIGNHTYDHPHFSDLTLEEGYEQISRTDDLIEDLYRQAGVPRPIKAFRFPYGDKGGLKWGEVLQPYSLAGAERKAALQAYLKKLGYTPAPSENINYQYYFRAGLHVDNDWYWTYDILDWSIYSDHPFEGIDSIEKVLARMDEDDPENGKGLNRPESSEIILTHDHQPTTQHFQAIINRLLEKGIQFISPVGK